jgi:hypothetical protein
VKEWCQFFNNLPICFSFIHKGDAMFITQQGGDGYYDQFLEWAAAQAETVGIDEEGGAMMYYSIIGFWSRSWGK